MSTSQMAVMLCGWGVKADMACLQVKLCVAIFERFRKCIGMQRRITNIHVYFTVKIFRRRVRPAP